MTGCLVACPHNAISPFFASLCGLLDNTEIPQFASFCFYKRVLEWSRHKHDWPTNESKEDPRWQKPANQHTSCSVVDTSSTEDVTHARTHTHACTHQGHSLNHAHTHTHLQMTHKDPHPPSQMKPSRCPTESAAKLGCSQMGIHQWTPIPGCSLPTMSDLCEKLKQVLNVGR